MRQGYIRPDLNLTMQDPDGAAAFCHHHDIMTNVSFSVSEQLRLVHILTYHAFSHVY